MTAWIRILPILLLLPLATSGKDDTSARPLKHSDVVFMGGGSKETYEAYGATVVDWGGHAWGTTEKARTEFRARVKLAQDLGIQYNAGIGMITEFLSMIKSCPEHERAICRTIDGKPMTVPWLWDHKVDGQLGKAWWFCSNSPLYQKFLRDRTALAMAGEPDGYHIDDYGGTTGTIWSGGCFCESCMPLFRDYLKQHLAPEKLREIDIEKLDDFDYGKWLLSKHVKDGAEFMKKRYTLPLYVEFREFQARAAGTVVRGLQEYAANLRGRPLARSVNGSPPGAQAFVVRPHVDHYSCEIGMGAPGSEWSGVSTKKLTASAAFVYHCADMVQRGIAGTADGHSWAYVNEKNTINLCRYWVAESYAFGHCFMAPGRHQWCYTKEKGTHWYDAKPKDYADLYQFVRKNTALFDDYEPVAQVGVIFSHTAWNKGNREPQAIATCLQEANIPFAFIAAGDQYLDLRLDAAKLAKFNKLVIPRDLKLDATQQKVLDQIPPGKTIVWKDAVSLRTVLNPPLAVEGAHDVWALPRRNPHLSNSPLIIHILNRNHDFATDRTITQQNLTLFLHDSLLNGHRPKHCKVFAPGTEPATAAVEADTMGVRVKLPEVKLWSVLRLE